MLKTICRYGEENMMLDVFSYTSAGGRSHNEDTIAYRTENGHGLFVVADGLGGHAQTASAGKAGQDLRVVAHDVPGAKLNLDGLSRGTAR